MSFQASRLIISLDSDDAEGYRSKPTVGYRIDLSEHRVRRKQVVGRAWMPGDTLRKKPVLAGAK